MPNFGATPNAVPSAARTTTGQSSAIDCGNSRNVALLVDVTAVSGTTPSATFSVEWSHDGTNWFAADPADVMTAITAAAKRVKYVDTKAPNMRLVWTITGTTPSFTFAAHAYFN